MVTLDEIKEAHSKYETLCKEISDNTSPLLGQISDLRSQISGLEVQVENLNELPQQEYNAKVAPLAEAYVTQLKDKYKDAPNSVTPEDFVVLSYGILEVMKSPELVTNFKETLEYLIKKLAEEGELEITLLENYPLYVPKGKSDGYIMDAYPIEWKHTFSSKNISVTLSLANVGQVLFDLGKHKVKSIRRSKSGYRNSFESEDSVKVPLKCLAERPQCASMDLTLGGYAKTELYVKMRKEGEEKGEIIFQYPSEEAISKGREYGEEYHKMTDEICKNQPLPWVLES